MRADFLDRYARGNTVFHRLNPRTKLLLVLLIVIGVLLTPVGAWPVFGCLACGVYAALVIAEIPTKYILQRIGLLLPPVLGLALSAPISRGFQGGWELAATITCRSLLTFSAGLWLVNTTPFETLLGAMARLGLPNRFVELLAFMYRYTFVVFDELARMRTGQRSRTFSKPGLFALWISNASLLGMLLIRSLNRAERIHGAMCSRGWTGRMPEQS